MRPFSLLIKPTGGDCNLNCRYCFYRHHKVGRMTDEIIDRTLATYMMTPILDHSICFQGGEPTLMPLEFYRRLDLFGCRVSLQTNGTLITPEWAEFFAENSWLIGVSLDGNENLNEIVRGGTEQAIRGIRLLERYGVDYCILTVVSRVNVNEPRQIDKYLSENFATPRRQYIRCAQEVSLEEYRRFCQQVGYERTERCCGEYFVVEHDGNIYPCDFFVSPEWRLGNVMTDNWAALQAGEKYIRFQRRECEMI